MIMVKNLTVLPVLAILLAVLLSACSAAGLVGPQAAAPTPTLDAAHWKVYQDLNHHFSFAYPKSYDDRALCAVKVKESSVTSPAFSVSMSNSDLKVSVEPLPDPKDTDPQTAVNTVRSMLSAQPQISLEKPQSLTVDGIPAMSQRYHTAYNKDGYLEYVFFKKGGMLYTIFINSPATCDGYPDTPTAEEAYRRILSSFHIQ